MAIEISVYNPKGGVGKTTVSLNLAGAFAHFYSDKVVQVVDKDPQGSAMLFQEIARQNLRPLGFEVVRKPGKNADVVIYDHAPGFDPHSPPVLAPVVVMPTILDALNWGPTIAVQDALNAAKYKTLILPNKVEMNVAQQAKAVADRGAQPYVKKRVSLSQCFDRGDTVFGSSYFANQAMAQNDFAALLQSVANLLKAA